MTGEDKVGRTAAVALRGSYELRGLLRGLDLSRPYVTELDQEFGPDLRASTEQPRIPTHEPARPRS
jgi:hypothetical protein